MDGEERWHTGVAGFVTTAAMNLTEQNMPRLAARCTWGGVAGLLVFRMRQLFAAPPPLDNLLAPAGSEGAAGKTAAAVVAAPAAEAKKTQKD